MAEPLKNKYNEQFFEKLIHNWRLVQPSIKALDFLQNVHNLAWKQMELKERIAHIAICMNKFLPQPYEKAIQKIVQLAHQLRNNTQEQSFEFLFLPEYILEYGIEHPQSSFQAMEEITQFVSCEFAVRPFLEEYPNESFETLLKWSKHPVANVRRLASEGSRPRLPWAPALRTLKKDPRPLLPILENLKDDHSLYVRKSVANNLNDISKDHPQFFIELLQEWKSKSSNRQWILKHASRTLLKKGYTEVMEFFDYNPAEHFQLGYFQLKQKEVNFGEALEFDFQIKNLRKTTAKLRLEYGIYFLKANGSHNKKVFKISERMPKPLEKVSIQRKHTIKAITTRKYYAGEHFIALIVNGKEIIKRNFTLVIKIKKIKNMLSQSIQEKLQSQIQKEASSSQLYLAMACWADVKGFSGVAKFLYEHSDEERIHMLKLIKFVNERGGHAGIPALESPKKEFDSLKSVFKIILEHEIKVTESINEIITACLKENDHTTNNFMQWYVTEQLEEEQMARSIIDKLEMIKSDTSSLYLFDKELGAQNVQ